MPLTQRLCERSDAFTPLTQRLCERNDVVTPLTQRRCERNDVVMPLSAASEALEATLWVLRTLPSFFAPTS